MDTSYFPIIRYCKSAEGIRAVSHTQRLRELVAERCGVDVEFIVKGDVANVLLHLLEQTSHEIDWPGFLKALDPGYLSWIGVEQKEPYWDRVANRLASEITMTRADDIPGYREWIAQQP